MKPLRKCARCEDHRPLGDLTPLISTVTDTFQNNIDDNSASITRNERLNAHLEEWTNKSGET